MLLPLLMTGFFAAATPQAGDTAPDFTVTDTSGKKYTLSEQVKEGPVIVAFFPKAFTPGCTNELTAYRDRYADIEKLKGQVLAVSMDDAETLKKFKESLKAPFAFIPDPDGVVVKQFDVKTPVMSYAQRYTFVVGEGRKILRVESGKDAIDPSAAIAACPLRKQDAKPEPKAAPH
ncbi:peroxiredoxin [Stigmatella sp. ncwal1]|uniref:thioredoxin-dependent peroxiredoxin n=1 Tax=Stigmatella ashevillensis TaxID=2995309 RepID=A0ABT5DAY8_9BACT|nr:peroxiredoxin [Stigmatella ashevillena]MDC0710214.1 peroxiredoxin [Stigmatella ashevillena]